MKSLIFVRDLFSCVCACVVFLGRNNNAQICDFLKGEAAEDICAIDWRRATWNGVDWPGIAAHNWPQMKEMKRKRKKKKKMKKKSLLDVSNNFGGRTSFRTFIYDGGSKMETRAILGRNLWSLWSYNNQLIFAFLWAKISVLHCLFAKFKYFFPVCIQVFRRKKKNNKQ